MSALTPSSLQLTLVYGKQNASSYRIIIKT